MGDVHVIRAQPTISTYIPIYDCEPSMLLLLLPKPGAMAMFVVFKPGLYGYIHRMALLADCGDSVPTVLFLLLFTLSPVELESLPCKVATNVVPSFTLCSKTYIYIVCYLGVSCKDKSIQIEEKLWFLVRVTE